MQHNSMGQMNDYLNQSKRKIRRRRVFSALSAAVVLGVVVNLMEPASTLTREVICGLEEHTHAEACYADGALICGLPEHAHTEDCYALTRSEAELLAETPESTQDELPGELTAEAVDDEVGEAQDVELTDTEEQTSVGNDETDDTFIPDENPDPLEAYIITEAGTVSAGEPIDLELVHFGGMEPVRRALLVWQGEDTLIDEANAEETVTITPETDETVQIALVAIDANGESATAEWIIPGAELEKQTEVDKTADEEQTEVENDDPEEQAGVEGENAIESDTEEDVTEKSDREEAVDVETENTDVADEVEAAPEAEEAIEETVEKTAEEEDTAEEDTEEGNTEEEDTEEGNTGEEIGEEADTDEEVNEAETDAEADVEDVEEEKEAGEEEPDAALLTFEGEDFTVTLKWSEAFSEDAALLVREIDADSEDYAASLAAAEAALNPSKAKEEAPAEEIVEEIESTGNIEEAETPDEASGDESTEQETGEEAGEETGEEEAGEETGETVKLNARFFTVAVAQGDEISVPAGGEITVVSTNEGAMLVRIVDGAAHTGDGIFADYQGEALGIVTVEAMETSAEPEPAAEEPAKEPGEEPLEEPADEAAEPDCEAGALVATGEGYTVTMTYEADAQIPADAALAVREIPFGTPEYAEYFNQAGDALSENWDEATALPRFFDITILCNEEEIQPAAPVSVQIALDEAVSVSADDEMRAIHFAEDAAQVLEAVSEQPAAEGPLPEAAEAVSFDAESFSVYGIVPTATITKKVITADGETFEIHVTYGKEAEIPEGVRLTAEEITAESDPETYNTYTALSARALTGDADAALKLARLFDIAIVDAEGARIEPGDTVSVEIRMVNAQDDEAVFDESGELAVSVADATVSEQDDVDFGADDLPAETAEAPGTEGEAAAETEPQPIQVVHFINGDEAQVITPEASADAETGADVVSFETESFSLYSVVQLKDVESHHQTTDPLGLDGRNYAIVSTNGNRWMGTRGWSNGLAGLEYAPLTAAPVNDTYTDTNVTTWTFHYNGEPGKYYISTVVNGFVRYLHFDPEKNVKASDYYDCALTLEAEPQELTITKGTDNKAGRYLIAYGEYQLNLNGSRGFVGNNGNYDDSYMRLCTYAPNSIQYQPVVIASERKNNYQNMAMHMAMQSSYMQNSNLAQKAIDLDTENTADFDQWQFLLQENGKYKIQSVSGANQQKYLKVGNPLDNNGPDDPDEHRRIDFTGNIADAAEFELNVLNGGLYAIRTVYEGKTYSIHKPNVDGFYLWKSNNDDEGNKMHLLLPKKGVLDLNGLETAIVSMNGACALTVSDDGSRAIATSVPVLADYDAGTYLDYVDAQGNHVANFSLWKFEKNDDGTYYLSTKVGDTTKYLKFDKRYDASSQKDDGGGQSLVTEKNEASRITVRVAKNGRYCLYLKANDNEPYGRYLLQWDNEIKNENRWSGKVPIEGEATGKNACDTFAFCAPVVKPLPNDVYGIACVANAYEDHDHADNVPNLQQLGNAMLRLEPDGNKLKVAKAFVWKDDNGKIVYFNSTGNNENVSELERPTQFYIEKATEGIDQYYIYGFTPGFGLRYLKLYDENDPKVTVSETPVTVTVSEATTSKGQTAYHIHNGDVYLRLNRYGDGNIQNFSAVTGVLDNDDARFMFVKPTDKTYPQFEHTGTKVGVTQIVNKEFNPNDQLKVLIYKTIYENGEYVTYGIDGDGTLVPAYDHGDQIMLYGKQENSAWWTVKIGDNGYVNFYNEVTKKYLCPQADGSVGLSETAPGVQLRSKIDRQDKDFVAHNAAIIKWDGDSYYGLEVNNGTLVSGIVTPTEYQEFSFAKVYVEGEKYDKWKHKVETVSDPNITVTMYDFPDQWDNHNHSTHAIAKTIGFVGYTKGATGTLYDAKPENDITRTLDDKKTGLMSSTLTNGWPTSTISNGETGNEQHSLKDLFQNGKTVDNTMFIKSIHDATGYYEYSAFDNFAHLKDNSSEDDEENDISFEVYEEIGAPHSESDDFFYNRGNFMPYNDLVKDSFSRNVNQFDGNGVQINMSDPTLGKELYNLDGSNYYFGMTIDAPFQQPKDGVLYNGEPIVLEFNGDDDMWVYIDDVLVLDIGGDHDAISGSINFTTGEVKVNSTNFNEVYSQYLTDKRLTIQEMFQRANMGNATTFKENGTFADYTTHKLRLFYMERGAAASNLHIKFNLQTVTPGALTLKKELDEDMQLDYGPEQKFYFQVFKKGGNTPLGASDINPSDDGITLLKSAKIGKDTAAPTTVSIGGKSYDNVFTLKANDELVLTSRDVTQQFYFKEISADVYDVEINGTPTNDTEDVQNYVYKSTDYKADGSKVIYHNANRKAQLEIQKVFDAEKYPSTAVPEFEFQVWLKKADGKYAYYEQGDYGLKNAEGEYLQKIGDPQNAYVVYDSASATGKISGIRPGETIVIPNLLPGTEYMVMEVDEGNLYNKSYSIDNTTATTISEADAETGTVVGAVTGKLPTTGEGTSRVFVGRVQDTNTPNNKVYLRKTDNSDTPNPLTGAEFRLSYLNGSTFTAVREALKPVFPQVGTDAQVEIGPLTYDTIYKLEETKAPDGYIITENGFLFRLTTNGTIELLKETTGDEKYVVAGTNDYTTIAVNQVSNVFTITVSNVPGARLPATGGMGTLPFTIAGLALILCAAMIMVLRRKDNY